MRFPAVLPSWLPVDRLVGIALMLALALLTFWLERLVQEEPRAPALRRHDPDYIVEKFTLVSYDRNGLPETTIAASRMAHYPDDDTTELIAPRMVHTRSGEPRITFDANRGVLSADGSELFFFGDTRLVRDAWGTAPRSEVRAEFLHALRDRGLVRTDRYVEVSEQGRSLTGRGMEYDNVSQQFILHHDVKGHFPTGTESR